MNDELLGFMAALFGQTKQVVEFRALVTDGKPKTLFTRDAAEFLNFIRRWDRAGNGVYFGMATRRTGGQQGRRVDLQELPVLWVDIDCLKMGISAATAKAGLLAFGIKPNRIVHSGGGLHAYWFLSRPIDLRIDADGNRVDPEYSDERIVAVLKQLAGVFAGDYAVCDLTRIMRVPTTHNWKPAVIAAHGGKQPAVIIDEASHAHATDFEALEELLAIARPLIARPDENPGSQVPATTLSLVDAYLRYAADAGYKTPLDVEARLGAMGYGAAGENGIHQTQLQVTASLVVAGWDEHAILDAVLRATQVASGAQAKAWNWRREERAILEMIASARTKFGVRAEPTKQGAADAEARRTIQSKNGKVGDGEQKGPGDNRGTGNGNETPKLSIVAGNDLAGPNGGGDSAARNVDPDRPAVTDRGGESTGGPSENNGAGNSEGNVVSIGAHKKRKAHDEATGPSEIEAIAQSVVKKWTTERGPLIFDGETLRSYARGYWHPVEGWLAASMRADIQGTCRALKMEPTSRRLNDSRRFIEEMPEILRAPEWDAAGLIVCRNCAINPRDGSMVAHSPEHYATWGLDIDYEPAAHCPVWLSFLDGRLADHDDHTRMLLVAAVQEWFGASLVRGLGRKLRRALIIYGPARTGKTMLANVARMLFGRDNVALHISALSQHFGRQSLVGASSLIADDAIGVSDELQEEHLKTLISGEPTTISRKNQRDWRGRLDLPILFTANHLPRVKDQSTSVYDRLILLPFGRQIADSDADDNLPGILALELPGILAWSIAGFQRLDARGMYDPPALLSKAMVDLRDDNDPAGAWMRECVQLAGGYRVDYADLRASYAGYTIANYGRGSRPLGGRALMRGLRAHIPQSWSLANNGRRLFGPVRLSEEGLSLIDIAKDAGVETGSGKGKDQVNQFGSEPTAEERER